MRQGRTAVVVAATLGLVAVASTAQAATVRLHEAPLEVTGALVITWQGDTARGCRDAGMCDTTGTITWHPGSAGSLTMRRSGSGWRLGDEPEADLEDAGEAIARTERGDRVACVDSVPQDFSGLAVQSNVLTLGEGFFGTTGTLSSGRCAGPRPADLKDLLPSARIDTAKLGSGQLLDFAGRRPFTAGPLSGEIVSTVRMAVGRPRLGDSSLTTGSSDGRRPGRTIHVEVLRLTYDVQRVAGTVSTAFEGLPDPDCNPLDACGLKGTVEHSVSGGKGALEVFANRRRLPGSRVTLARSLAAARAGRLRFQAFMDVEGMTATTTQRTIRTDGDDCTDTLTGLEATVSAQARRVPTRRVELSLSPTNRIGGTDALRTRCPGPSRRDMFGDSSLGLGQIPVSALGSPALRVPLRRAGGFLSSAYIGSRTADVGVELRLKRATAQLVREVSG